MTDNSNYDSINNKCLALSTMGVPAGHQLSSHLWVPRPVVLACSYQISSSSCGGEDVDVLSCLVDWRFRSYRPAGKPFVVDTFLPRITKFCTFYCAGIWWEQEMFRVNVRIFIFKVTFYWHCNAETWMDDEWKSIIKFIA